MILVKLGEWLYEVICDDDDDDDEDMVRMRVRRVDEVREKGNEISDFQAINSIHNTTNVNRFTEEPIKHT